jgi:hypothetical protein
LVPFEPGRETSQVAVGGGEARPEEIYLGDIRISGWRYRVPGYMVDEELRWFPGAKEVREVEFKQLGQ